MSSLAARTAADAAAAQATAGAAPGVSRSTRIRIAIACSALLALGIVAATAAIIVNLHTRAVADAERSLHTMAIVLAAQAENSFEALALVESSLIDRMENLGIKTAGDLSERMAGYDAHLLLADTINGLRQVESIAVIDASGRIVNFSRAWPVPAISIADRAYFKTLMADRGLTWTLSEPILNRTTGTWSIYLARKIFAADGTLLGLVVGGLEQRYFEQFFNNLALEPGTAISLIRGDGAVLASYPQVSGVESARSEGGWLHTLLGSQQHGATRMIGATGEVRFVAARVVPHFPLIVSISASSTAILADWISEVRYLGGAAFFLVLAIAGLTFIGIRQFQSYAAIARERAERNSAQYQEKAMTLVLRETERINRLLKRQKLELDTVLENMAQGVVMLDADARMMVCNRRYIEMYGMSPDVVVPGCTLRELMEQRAGSGLSNGDIDEAVRKVLAVIARGGAANNLMPLADGRMIHVSTQPMAEGGWVATHQDVTDRHRAEREAERAQQFLSAVIENVPSTVVVKNVRDMRYVLINRAAEAFYGVPRSDLLGRTPHEAFTKETADIIIGHDQQLLQSDSEVHFDKHWVDTPANGRRLIVARRLAVRDKHGKPQFLLSVLDDITERDGAATHDPDARATA